MGFEGVSFGELDCRNKEERVVYYYCCYHTDVSDTNRRWKIHFHFHFVSFLVSFDNNKYKFAIALFLGLDFWVFHHSLWHCSSCYYSVAISFKNIRFNNITSQQNQMGMKGKSMEQ